MPGDASSTRRREIVNRWTAAFYFAQHEKIKAFNLLARPGCSAQKLQAGCHAGLAGKAADVDALTQLFPAVVAGQLAHDGFKLDAMQWVCRLNSTLLGRATLLNHASYLFFSLPRSGTVVTMVGRTASGDTVFGGEVSFFGFLTILPLFC